MNAQSRIEKIRTILVNDGRSWHDRPIDMLAEIEEIITPLTYTFKYDVTEALMDDASVDPTIEAELRAKLIARLDNDFSKAIEKARMS